MDDMLLAQIKNILCDKVEGFAKKVAPIYELLHWTWGMGNDIEIPNEYRISETLRKCINDLKCNDNKEQIVRLGGVVVGFKISKCKNDTDRVELIMAMEIENNSFGHIDDNKISLA